MALASCSKNASDGRENVPEGRMAHVSFSISAASAVKAETAKSATESQVNTLDAWVFNADGSLDAYGHWVAAADPAAPAAGEIVTTAGTTTNYKATEFDNRIEATTGAGKKIYVILNAEWPSVGNLDAIDSESALQAKVFSLAGNRSGAGTTASPFAYDNFEMIGYTEMSFIPGNNNAVISVNALVSRIELKKITKNFTAPSLNANLTIKRVFMSNVVGTVGFADAAAVVYKAGAAEPWFNKYGFDSTSPYVVAGGWPYASRIQHMEAGVLVDGFDTALDGFLYRDFASGAGYALAEDATLMADGSAVTGTDADAAHSLVFYVMPNNVPWGYDHDADASTPDIFGPIAGADWSPRHTRLVVEVEYEGVTYYYPIPIAKNGHYPMGDDTDDGTGYAGIEANFSYEIPELVLTRLGSRNLDEPVLPADVQFTITVNAWTQQLMQTEAGKYVI